MFTDDLNFQLFQCKKVGLGAVQPHWRILSIFLTRGASASLRMFVALGALLTSSTWSTELPLPFYFMVDLCMFNKNTRKIGNKCTEVWLVIVFREEGTYQPITMAETLCSTQLPCQIIIKFGFNSLIRQKHFNTCLLVLNLNKYWSTKMLYRQNIHLIHMVSS